MFFLQILSNRLRAASSERGSAIPFGNPWVSIGISPESWVILRFRSSISRASLSFLNISFSFCKASSRAQGSSGHWPVSPRWLASKIGSWENGRLEYLTKQEVSHLYLFSVLGMIISIYPWFQMLGIHACIYPKFPRL